MTTIRNSQTRQQRRAAAKLAKKQRQNWNSSDEPSSLKALISVGFTIAILASVIYFAFIAPATVTQAEANSFSRAISEPVATLVFERPAEKGEKTALVYKYCHGGASSIKRLLSDDEILKSYLRHQEVLYQTNRKLLDKIGPAQYRCFLEGFSEDGRTISRQVAELGEGLAEFSWIYNALNSTDFSDPKALAAAKEALSSYGEGGLRMLGWQSRFFIYLQNSKDQSVWDCLHGADIPGFAPLVTPATTRFMALATAEEIPQDAELVEFLSWLQKAQASDSAKRHEHLAKLIARTPKGSVSSVILGGNHSGYGTNLEPNKPESSVESYLVKISGLNIMTWEERSYANYLELQRGKLTLSADMSLEDFRALVLNVREQLKQSQ